MNPLLRNIRCPHDVSEKLTITLSKARRLVQEQTDDLPGWGPSKKQRHIISRRGVFADWPREHRERIQYYRKLHDQGRVSMCQGRDGDYFILYAFPAPPGTKRVPYFYTQGA